MSAQSKKRAEEEMRSAEEEDFEEVMREAVSAAPARRKFQPPKQQVIINIPEVVDDFLRNQLRKAGLRRTLEIFESEWSNKLLREMQAIPDALTHRQLLQSELDAVRGETDILKQKVLAEGETMARMQRERDFHRLQYKRVAEEKNKLIEDLKQLKKHLGSYEPALKQLEEKYQTALRQKTHISLEKDRIQNTSESRLKQENLQIKQERIIRGSDGTDNSPSKSPTKRHPQDSEFPLCSRQVNPHSAQVEAQNWKKPSSFSLTCSIRAHELSISCISLHPRKLILASASDDRSWRLWALPARGEKVGQMVMTGEGHSDWLSGCSFHPDGTKLATTSGDTTVRLWDFSLGHCIMTLSGHSQPTWSCSFHSGGHFLASCSADRTTKLWDLNSQRCRLTLRRHTASINSVHFLRYSNLLLTCSADKTLALWDARLGICTATFRGHQHPCNHSAFSLATDTVASCDARGVINLWDIRNSASPLATVDAGPLGVNQVAFSCSGKMLAAACSDSLVRLVEIDSCAVTSLSGHSGGVHSVTFDHMGETVVSAGSDGMVNMWS